MVSGGSLKLSCIHNSLAVVDTKVQSASEPEIPTNTTDEVVPTCDSTNKDSSNSLNESTEVNYNEIHAETSNSSQQLSTSTISVLSSTEQELLTSAKLSDTSMESEKFSHSQSTSSLKNASLSRVVSKNLSVTIQSSSSTPKKTSPILEIPDTPFPEWDGVIETPSRKSLNSLNKLLLQKLSLTMDNESCSKTTGKSNPSVIVHENNSATISITPSVTSMTSITEPQLLQKVLCDCVKNDRNYALSLFLGH